MAWSSHLRDWEELSQLDPLWAIASDPSKRFGGWSSQAFLASGVDIVAPIIARADQLGRPVAHDTALDFGCGAGRLTRALSPHFHACLGVDIAPQMVDLASELNHDVPNCRFETGVDLAGVPDASFDFVLSLLVLQHLPGRRAVMTTLTDLVRVVKPDGLLVFQLPTHLRRRHRLQPRRRAYRALRRLGVAPAVLYRGLGLQPIRMTATGSRDVSSSLERCGGKILAVDHAPATGGMISSTFWVTR